MFRVTHRTPVRPRLNPAAIFQREPAGGPILSAVFFSRPSGEGRVMNLHHTKAEVKASRRAADSVLHGRDSWSWKIADDWLKLQAEVERLEAYPDAIATVRARYPIDVFPDTNGAAKMARLTCDNIERLVREAAEAAGGDDGDQN